MKVSIIVAAGLALSGAAGAALAQITTVIEPTVTVGSTEPTPERPAVARKEAAAALAQAKKDCRRQPDRDAQKACMADARNDYNDLMAMAASKR
jgi:hypothetical protein